MRLFRVIPFAWENAKLPTEWRFFFRLDESDDGPADWGYPKGNFKAADLLAYVIAKDRVSWRLLWATPRRCPCQTSGTCRSTLISTKFRVER